MEEILGSVRKVEYTGNFKGKDAVTIIRDSLEGFGYIIAEKDVSGDKNKIKLVWVCEKEFDDYTKSQINIECTVKSKGEEAEISVEFKGKLYTDYKNRWEGHPIKKILKEIYDSTIYKDALKRFKDKINEEMLAVVDDVKGFLNMYRVK